MALSRPVAECLRRIRGNKTFRWCTHWSLAPLSVQPSSTSHQCRYTLIAARASYHLREVAKNDRLDPYIGAAVGYNRVSVEAKGSFISSEPFGADSYALYGAYAGARYLLNERVAGFVELGFGIVAIGAQYADRDRA
jgi:hypothetical protein